ncbi:hypothetical protein ACFV5G_13745 [Streptomyces sp. NPDC059766]
MPFIMAEDGTEIVHNGWGASQAIVFGYGWPVTADVWDPQPSFVADNG